MAIGGRAGEVFTEINVTPLTDVFLVLLVIMILIAPLVNSTVLQVKPPPKVGQNIPPPEEKGPKIAVKITANGQILVNGKAVTPPDTSGVTAAIKTEQKNAGQTDIPLNLQSENDALQKYVVAVMDASAGCGIKQLNVLPLKD